MSDCPIFQNIHWHLEILQGSDPDPIPHGHKIQAKIHYRKKQRVFSVDSINNNNMTMLVHIFKKTFMYTVHIQAKLSLGIFLKNGLIFCKEDWYIQVRREIIRNYGLGPNHLLL